MTSARPAAESSLQLLLKDATLAGSWTLDPSRSVVSLRSRSMWGLAPVSGVFREISGDGTVTPGGEVTGTVAVAAGSVDTGNKKRDAHLRSAEFFDVGDHPHITVEVERVRPSGAGATVTGTLSVRGRTRPVSFSARVSVADQGEVWLDAELQVDRSDFGMTWNQLGMASMHNTITVHAVFTRT